MSLIFYNFSSTPDYIWKNNPIYNYKSFINFKELSYYKSITIYDDLLGMLSEYKKDGRENYGYYPSDFIINPSILYDEIIPTIIEKIKSRSYLSKYKYIQINFSKFTIKTIFELYLLSEYDNFDSFLDSDASNDPTIDPNYINSKYTYREWLESAIKMISDITKYLNNIFEESYFCFDNIFYNYYNGIRNNKEDWIEFNEIIYYFISEMPFILCNISIDKYISGGKFDGICNSYEIKYDVYKDHFIYLLNTYYNLNKNIFPIIEMKFGNTNLESVFFSNRIIGSSELECFLESSYSSGIYKVGFFAKCESKEDSYLISSWVNTSLSLSISRLKNTIDIDTSNIFYSNSNKGSVVSGVASSSEEDCSYSLQEEIDMRPVRFYDMYDGSYSANNPCGLSDWWMQDDSVDVLINNVSKDYLDGFRKFVFYLPAGTRKEQYNTNHWYTIDENKRNKIREKIGLWTSEHQDASIFVYSGLLINDNSYDLYLDNIEFNLRIPDIRNTKDASYLRDNWCEWFDIGVKGIIFHCQDNDLRKSVLIYDLYKHYNSIGIKVKISPLLIVNGSYYNDICKYPIVDSISLASNYDFSFNPKEKEITLIIPRNNNSSLSDIESIAKRGFCIGSFGFWADSYLNKIYDNFTLPLIDGSEYSEESSSVTFSIENEAASDRGVAFGVERYKEVSGYAVGDYIPFDIQDCNIICFCNSVDGIFSFNQNLSKYDTLEVSLNNVSFRNTSLPHRVLEDSMESINSGMPSSLSQVNHSNVVNVGIFYERQFPGIQNSISTPYQAKFISPCNLDWYNTLYSTIDNELDYDLVNMNRSLPYASSILYVPEMESILVGGIGGILKISIENKYISGYDIDSSFLVSDIKNLIRYQDDIFILTNSYLYKYNVSSESLYKDSGYGLPGSLYVFSIMPNNTMIIGAEDGVYVKKINNNKWEKVINSSEKVEILISPDSAFAVVDNSIWYSNDGLSWNKKGSISSDLIVNCIIRYKSQFYIGTNSGLFADNGSFYNDRINLSLVDIMNDIESSSSLKINHMCFDDYFLYIGMYDGEYFKYDSEFTLYSDSMLNSIHKMTSVSGKIWMFGYDYFRCFDESIIRKLATGGIIESLYGTGGSIGSGGGGGLGGSGGGSIIIKK